MRIYYITIFLTICQIALGQNKSPYQIFEKNGNKTDYFQLVKKAEQSQIVLFGEHHDNPIAHWLELELAKELFEKKPLILGAEMLETDNQNQLNSYLAGEINQKEFDTIARLWPNYKTDYKPLVDFAKEKKISFVATNIPRRFASMVFKLGFEALEKLTLTEKSLIAPLPILYDGSLLGYKNMLKMDSEHSNEKMPKAQAIKDATMAYFIYKNIKQDAVFLHFNGTYHSDNFEGIYWYLKKENPNLKIITIATVTQKNVEKLEIDNHNKADFILVIDEDVARTY